MSGFASLQDSTEHNTRTAIRLMIQRCENIPSVPWAIAPIVALAGNLHSSLDHLETAIEGDPACTARLLQKANVAFYASDRAVTSIRRAIMMFGYGTVEQIANELVVFECFHTHNSAEIAQINSVWTHCRAVARLARRIAYDVRHAVEADVAYCAGLLHDLGQIVLLHLFPEVYYQLLGQMASDPAFELTKAEQEVFHITHAEAGRWLAETWRFPAPIVRVLSFHHNAQLSDPLVAVVMLADHLVKRRGIGYTGNTEPFATPDRLCRALRCTQSQLEQYTRFLEEHAEAMACPSNLPA